MLACTGNKFGYNCNITCHCKSGGCDTVIGVCEQSGCDVGWSGDSCDLGTCSRGVHVTYVIYTQYFNIFLLNKFR